MNSTTIKRIFKQTIPLLPGYHSLCVVLQKYRPKKWEWIDRIPVKPGIPILVHSSVGNFYMSRPERCSIAKKYFWTQGVREPVEDRIALNLFAILSKQSNAVLDIGANSGLFSLVAAKSNPSAEIFAFDILPEAYHVVIDNLILNNLQGKVDIQLIGVGEGGKIFYAPFNNISSDMPSSLSLDCNSTNGDQVQVSVKSLDEICIPRLVGKTLCIKIDVEGTEVDIFLHGRETLSAIKPDIICEVLPGARQFEIYDQILDDYSYCKYLITNEGVKLFDRIKPHSQFKDWFFTTKKNIDIDIEELLN
jgi:FkbM family methyltransferase